MNGQISTVCPGSNNIFFILCSTFLASISPITNDSKCIWLNIANFLDELNKCFIALRQACCRDSGQLGTPCRLKMMELVELRAMGWRPNLAHTQYYLNRPEQPPPGKSNMQIIDPYHNFFSIPPTTTTPTTNAIPNL